MPSVSDDEIVAELVAGLSPEEAAELLAARLHLAALEDEAARAEVPADGQGSRRRDGDPRDLIEAAARVRPVALAREQLLAVTPELAPLLPDGALRRGSTVAVGSPDGSMVGGATSLALALTAAASAEGSWVALVGLPAVGLVAAAELGLAVDRLAVVTSPPPEQWATVVAALVGAFDLVLVPVAPRARTGEVRRLTARARERGSVLIQLVPFDLTLDPTLDLTLDPTRGLAREDGRRGVGRRGGRSEADPATPGGIGLEADVRLTVTATRWQGVSGGAGHLQARRLTVETSGRRRAAHARRHDLWLPGGDDVVVDVDVLGHRPTSPPIGQLRRLDDPTCPPGDRRAG